MKRGTLLTLSAAALLAAGLGVVHYFRPGEPDSHESRAVAAPTERDGFVAVGKYRLKLAIAPRQPQVGQNRLSLELRDAAGKPVTGATLRVLAEMPAMGAMPAMRAQAEVTERGGGHYEGELELPMAGEWPLAVDVETETLGHGDLVYDMSTARPGLKTQVATPEGIAHYTCPMHPSVKSAQPGQCPICGMDLVAVKTADLKAGSILLDATRRQAIGLTLAKVERRKVERIWRLPAELRVDETRQQAVALRADGWIGELYADYVGKAVKAGEPLFTWYSPAVLAAQEEYLAASKRPGPLLEAAGRRLRLLGLTEAQLAELRRRGKPLDYVPVHAPRDGVVLAKSVVAGSPVSQGQEILRLADLSTLWLEAEAFAPALARLRPGQTVAVRLAEGEPALAGTVAFVEPAVMTETRTARLRVLLSNTDGRLRPGQYATAELSVPLGEQLVVPEGAVLYAGERRVVFIDVGGNRLKPRLVRVGERLGNELVITEGLAEGETVVASGVFLVASESKLKTGGGAW
ncbi:MAG: efflux RND transporter periplasmic adaptor subunit [Gammaproteobacteria bacterium]|nr:efflux RND transporter periplasmic adaptor subunit [Gammaproteobacteria bacterium]